METARLSDQGQDVIFLTVGDQDLAAREPGIDAPDRGAFRGPRLRGVACWRLTCLPSLAESAWNSIAMTLATTTTHGSW